MSLYWVLPVCVPFPSSGKVNKCCYIYFTGLYRWNFGVERLSYFFQFHKKDAYGRTETLIQIFCMLIMVLYFLSLSLIASLKIFIYSQELRFFVSLKLSFYWLREEHCLIRWFWKQIPSVFFWLIAFPMVLLLFWVFASENTLICSSLMYLQYFPHAAPSAWITSLKPFYCPLTIYPYSELTSALPPRKKISFLISTARNKPQIWTKTMAFSYCDVQNTFPRLVSAPSI